MTANLNESYAVRHLSHEHVDQTIAVRRMYLLTNKNFYRHRQQDITDTVVENLHKFCQLLLDTKHRFKLVVEFRTIRLYAESDELFQEILASDVNIANPRCSRANINRPKDTIQLKNPRHTHRSYFKRTAMTESEKRAVGNFLSNNAETLRPSPALEDWLKRIDQWAVWTEPHFFVDHNDESWMVMLSLIRPRLIKKTIQLIKS